MILSPEVQKLLLEVGKIAATNEKDAQKKFYDGLLALGQDVRLDNLYHCKNKATKQKSQFIRNDEQKIYCKNQTRRDNILKPRQIGFTELTIKIGVDNCIFAPGAQEGLMADKKQKAVAELFQRVRDTFDWFIETWGALIPIVFGKDEANKVIIESVCGIQMKTSYQVAADFRGTALKRLHCSEAARISPDLLRGAADAVPEGGQIIHETTAKGRGGVFYTNWTASKKAKRKNDVYVWENHFFPWFHHYPEAGTELKVPEFPKWDEQELFLKKLGASDLSLTWRRWKIQENFLDEPEKFDEEYPSDDESCFLGGSSIVPLKYRKLMDRWVLNPIKVGHIFPKGSWMEFVDEPSGYVSIWEMPKAGEQYVIGADPSEGVGKDRAAAYVKKRSNRKYVARVWGQLYPEEFADTLNLIGRFYASAHICFETNNHGWVVKDRLVQARYPNLYHRRELEEVTGKWTQQIGFKTDRNSKERIVMNFVARLREGKLHPMDDELLTEVTNVERDENGRIGAIFGEHDDLFMAACLTEEMDVALGEYRRYEEEEQDEIKCDPFTGYPIL